MALPLEAPQAKRNPLLELQARLDRAPVEHAEALLAAYEVLEGLHARGVLEILRGALGSSEKILEISVDAARGPQAIRTLRNAFVMANLIGEIDPERLGIFAKTSGEALAMTEPATPPGVWSLLRKLLSGDVRRGLSFGLSMLGTLGRNLASTTKASPKVDGRLMKK